MMVAEGFRLRQQILLVENGDNRVVICPQLMQRLVDDPHLDFHLRIRRIDHMDQDICTTHFFQRTLECLDQMVRQLADKSNRIGQQHLLLSGETDAARCRIQRRKQLCVLQDIRAGHPLKNRRFANGGIADERRNLLL